MVSATPAWSLERLERACRKVLASRSNLSLKSLPAHIAADVTWAGEGKAKIRVDGHKVGVRTAVIHELLHVVLDDELRNFDTQTEEAIIEALEEKLDRRIAASRRRMSWWRKTIQSKIAK